MMAQEPQICAILLTPRSREQASRIRLALLGVMIYPLIGLCGAASGGEPTVDQSGKHGLSSGYFPTERF